MSPKSYPEFQHLRDAAHTCTTTYLASPPPSPNASDGRSPTSPAKPDVLTKRKLGSPDLLRAQSPVHRPKSALLNKDKRTRKKVHWDSTVIDNEQKMRPHPRSNANGPSDWTGTSSSENTMFPSKSGRPPSPSIAPRATTKLMPSSSRVTTQSMVPKPQTANTTAKRDPGSLKRTIKSPAKTIQSPRINHGRAVQRRAHVLVNVGQEAPGQIPRLPMPQSAVRKNMVPPQVPDPPQRQQPPPTPRPARLPTPDLSEIGDRPFCMCWTPYCTGYHGHPSKPVHLKMDTQLEAAIAYMKDARRQ